MAGRINQVALSLSAHHPPGRNLRISPADWQLNPGFYTEQPGVEADPRGEVRPSLDTGGLSEHLIRNAPIRRRIAAASQSYLSGVCLQLAAPYLLRFFFFPFFFPGRLQPEGNTDASLHSCTLAARRASCVMRHASGWQVYQVVSFIFGLCINKKMK